jgi:hypothetical protein
LIEIISYSAENEGIADLNDNDGVHCGVHRMIAEIAHIGQIGMAQIEQLRKINCS